MEGDLRKLRKMVLEAEGRLQSTIGPNRGSDAAVFCLPL